jgi:hypothetical protein
MIRLRDAAALAVALALIGGLHTAPARATTQTDERSGQTLIPRRPVAKPQQSEVGKGQDPTHVVLKFAEGADVVLSDGAFASPSGKFDTKRVNEAIAAQKGRPAPAFAHKPEDLRALAQKAELRSGREQADLHLYFDVRVPKGTPTVDLLNALNAEGVVEIAYAAPIGEEPGHQATTPNYEGAQGYTDPAPGGVNSDYANTVAGGNGSGVRIVDVERGWNFGHEDISSSLISGANRPGSANHGTAVLGEMVGTSNGFGVTGMVPGASARASSACRVLSAGECSTYSLAQAVVDAVAHLVGDGIPAGIILIEQHFSVGGWGYLPVEVYQAEYDALAAATGAGITVVEAAGNGGNNLDAYTDGGGNALFDPSYRDSGAIMVGAGCAPTAAACADRTALSFSNFGKRVDVQGWGHMVTTAGYGDLFGIDGVANNANRYYTSGFNGTSSASPIVTGAAAALLGRSVALWGSPMSPWNVRSLLRSTGTAQPAGDAAVKPIGPRPNLHAALTSLWWWIGHIDDFVLEEINPFDDPWPCLRCPPFILPWTHLRVHEKHLLIDLELPGIDPKRHATIDVSKQRLAVYGQRPLANGKMVDFKREMALPSNVDTSSMRWTYDDGMLQIAFLVTR